jgi:hypothetical protein
MFNTDGLHLSAGQTITIPVNDIYEVGFVNVFFRDKIMQRSYAAIGLNAVRDR